MITKKECEIPVPQLFIMVWKIEEQWSLIFFEDGSKIDDIFQDWATFAIILAIKQNR